jgi:hypothetical protein
MSTADIQSFAAYEAILKGEWDRYLMTLAIAIRRREMEIREGLMNAGDKANGKP